MAILVSHPKPGVQEATTVSSDRIGVTVTGVDIVGQMFRHSATVLMLDGCECALRCKSRPEIDGSILVEFDYPPADSKSSRSRVVSHGRVKLNQEEIDSGFYKVVIVLEVAQTLKVLPKELGTQTLIKKPALQPATATSVGSAES